jgi:hypothetical protein
MGKYSEVTLLFFLARERRGPCLSPLNAPTINAMMTIYLMRSYRIWEGHIGEIRLRVQVFRITFSDRMRGLLPIFPSGTMTAAAPDGSHPRQIGDKKI